MTRRPFRVHPMQRVVQQLFRLFQRHTPAIQIPFGNQFFDMLPDR